LQHPLVTVSVESTKCQQSSGVAVTASTSSCVTTVVSSRSLTTAAGPRCYQSPQSDNSFDAEYCDVEPDSSPGSVTNDDAADLSVSAAVATSAVSDYSKDTLSSNSIVQAWLGNTEMASLRAQSTVITEMTGTSTVTSECAVHNTLPILGSTALGDLPKSSFALTFDKFPSPVKYNADLFSPILPLPTTYSLMDYTAPVMAAESVSRCVRFLPATAAALCDTSTVSSPSFARSLCASVSTMAKNRHQEPVVVSESSNVDSQVCGMSIPSFVSGIAQHSTVVSSSTPVMADVLQAQLDQGSIHQLSATGLPVMRTAVDHALLNALLSQAQLGIPKTEALAGTIGRQQLLPNDLTVPVIAFLNLGAGGTGSLPSFSCAAVLPPGALQFLKVSLSHESNTSSQTAGIVSSVGQAKML